MISFIEFSVSFPIWLEIVAGFLILTEILIILIIFPLRYLMTIIWMMLIILPFVILILISLIIRNTSLIIWLEMILITEISFLIILIEDLATIS